MSDSIDISGLKKADVLAALFNNSKQQGLGFLNSSGQTNIDSEEAQQIIDESGLDFDYLRGRVMKINLEGDKLQIRLYDRDNGEGAAAIALAALVDSSHTKEPVMFENQK